MISGAGLQQGLLAGGLLLGAAVALLLLVLAAKARSRTAAVAAFLLLIASATGGVILWSWTGPDMRERLELVELALAMASGPLILLLVATLLRVRVRPWIPAGLALIAFALLVAQEALWGGDPIVPAIPVMTGFTLWGWGLLVLSRDRGRTLPPLSRAAGQRRLALGILLALSAANAASLARFFYPGVAALKPLVPATISVLFTALLAGIVWTFLARHASIFAKAPGAGSREAELLARATQRITADRLYAEPDLRVEDAAAQLGVSASALAAAFAASEHGSFAAWLHGLRLDRARDMLRHPAERSTSVEAIALLCGFRSRSTFYEGFRRRFGTTPAAWRERANSLSGD